MRSPSIFMSAISSTDSRCRYLNIEKKETEKEKEREREEARDIVTHMARDTEPEERPGLRGRRCYRRL
jgi:hypothetical protein